MTLKWQKNHMRMGNNNKMEKKHETLLTNAPSQDTELVKILNA